MGSASGSPSSTGDDSSPSYTLSRHVSSALGRLEALLPFALVPFVLSVLELENVRRTIDTPPGSFSINVELALPSPLLGLWTFADPPEPATTESVPGSTLGPGGAAPDGRPTPGSTGTGSGDVTVETPFETLEVPLGAVDGDLLAWFAAALLVYAAGSAVIAAGYLGGIDRRLRDERAAVVRCVVDYAPRLFAYHLVTFGAFVVFVPFLAVAPLLFVLAVPAVLVLGYLFYATPFLFVVDDAGFLEAFRRSYEFAIDGGPYLGFALGHVVVAAVSSIGLSIVVSAGGVLGLLIALAVATPLALVLTTATVSFVRELVERDDESTTGRPRFGSAPDDGADSAF